MKANELRLGNIINIGGNTIDTYQTYKPCKVNINVLKDIVQENMERPEAILSAWHPIPLTPQLLEKCGFDCDGYVRTPVYSNLSFSITIWEDGRLFYDWIGGNIEIKSLHQLQNLYFALTGEELEIDLKSLQQ